MTPKRKVILALMLGVVVPTAGFVGWIGCEMFYTLQHIPEGYAAWDTGTLLVEYIKAHGDRWPRSWDDLLTVLDTDEGRQVMLRGARAGDRQYGRSLRDRVAVDWAFDPQRPRASNPVTRSGGGAFRITWAGADPNDMVRSYLKEQATKRPVSGGRYAPPPQAVGVSPNNRDP